MSNCKLILQTYKNKLVNQFRIYLSMPLHIIMNINGATTQENHSIIFHTDAATYNC